MANITPISWCTHTVNWQGGCSKISRACRDCYALRDSWRFAHKEDGPDRYKAGVVGKIQGAAAWTGKIGLDPDWRDRMARIFHDIRRAIKSRRTWTGSMTDLWHESIPVDAPQLGALAEEIHATFCGQTRVPQVLILLTKRPERLLAWQRRFFPDGLPAGVEVGTTAEDQRRADERVPVLLQVRAECRFLSCEPLLGPIDLAGMTTDPPGSGFALTDGFGVVDGMTPPRLHLVIVGGESGHRARPTHPDWFRQLRDQCSKAGVMFHFKQWGEMTDAEHAPDDFDVSEPNNVEATVWTDGSRIHHGPWEGATREGAEWMYRVGKKQAGRLLDDVLHDALPAFPAVGGLR